MIKSSPKCCGRYPLKLLFIFENYPNGTGWYGNDATTDCFGTKNQEKSTQVENTLWRNNKESVFFISNDIFNLILSQVSDRNRRANNIIINDLNENSTLSQINSRLNDKKGALTSLSAHKT